MTVTSVLWKVTTDIMKSPDKIAGYAALGFDALAVIELVSKGKLSKKCALPLIGFNVLCPILMIRQASLSESIDQAKANTTSAADQIGKLNNIIEELKALNLELEKRLACQEDLLKDRAGQIEQLSKTVAYLSSINPSLTEAATAVADISTTMQAHTKSRQEQLRARRAHIKQDEAILMLMRGKK